MEQFTRLDNDLGVIAEVFETLTDDEFYSTLGNTKEEILDIYKGIKEPTKMQLENIYNFAYKKGLNLNEISWQEVVDRYNKRKNKLVLSHGSGVNIKGDIRLDVSGESNDFSDGFYMGESLAQAGMFVADKPNSSLYVLVFDKTDLKPAKFTVSVDWMLAICWYRDQIPHYADHPRIKAIRAKVAQADYVYAPIADNKLFDIIALFASNQITDMQCLYALTATHLGYQYVLKTPKCLENVEIKEHLYYCALEKDKYYKMGVDEENTSMYKSLIARRKFDGIGRTIGELLR